MYTSVNGVQKGYFYNDGYIRTSCKEYNTNNLNNKFVHLTNDAIQKKSDDYGKFESGNKVWNFNHLKFLDVFQRVSKVYWSELWDPKHWFLERHVQLNKSKFLYSFNILTIETYLRHFQSCLWQARSEQKTSRFWNLWLRFHDRWGLPHLPYRSQYKPLPWDFMPSLS